MGPSPCVPGPSRGGAIDFLQKPVDGEALRVAIATALEQDVWTRDHQRHRTALQATVPLSVSRHEDIRRVRSFAEGRFTPVA